MKPLFFRFVPAILLSSLVLLLSACGNGRSSERFTELHWLLGKWKAEDKGYVFHEQWVAEGDSMLKGSSMILQNSDTVFRENMSIVFNEKGIFFLGVFPGQNNGQPIWFQLKLDNENPAEQIFENEKQVFPKQIIYTKTSETSYIAGIAGGEGKDYHRRELGFTREN